MCTAINSQMTKPKWMRTYSVCNWIMLFYIRNPLEITKTLNVQKIKIQTCELHRLKYFIV